MTTAARSPTRTGPVPIPPKATPKVEPKAEAASAKRKWFKLAPKADHSHEGFVIAIRRAIDDLSEVNWNSPDNMCDGIEEHIRKALNAPVTSIHCSWVGGRRTNKAARLVIWTNWGLREDVEGMLSFALFAMGQQQ